MALKRKTFWVIIIVVVLGIFIFAFQGKKTTGMDANLQYLHYDQFMEYLYESEDVTRVEKRTFDQKVRDGMDRYGVSPEDTFFVVEFTPEHEDDVLDKLILAACMDQQGKIFPMNYGTAVLRADQAESGHQCLYNMTFDFTAKNQVKYAIEGQITNYRTATQSALYEDDIMVCEKTLSKNVYANPPLEKEDILLVFHGEGTMDIKNQ